MRTIYDTGLLKADYGYSFFMDHRLNMAVTGGLYVIPITLGVENQITGEQSKTNISAPLPLVGVSFDFAISPKWFLRQHLEIFYLDFGDFQGGIVDSAIAVEYKGWERWGVGAAIDAFRMNVKPESENGDLPGVDFIGHLKLNFIGLELYGTYQF